eukprot:scaffold44339_cov204-Skeletonema_marinoi.AAC.3
MSRESKIDCSIQHQADTMRARSKEKSAANVELYSSNFKDFSSCCGQMHSTLLLTKPISSTADTYEEH